ncbi:(2Fe-2S)-binding protein, partial [Halomonas sp. BBD45]
LWIAGDGGGIGGALNAEREGCLAALDVLASLDIETPDALGWERQALQHARHRDLEARRLLETLFRLPVDWLDLQPEDTLICRCESVSRGEVEHAIAQGAAGPNQLKAFTRCGMGPCQGRQCGESIARLLARRTSQPLDTIGYYHIRPPVHSVTLGELASQQDT